MEPEFSVIPLVIDTETGEKWRYGVAESMLKTLDPGSRNSAQREYSLLQLEVMSGIALKYATRKLHLSLWAV